MEKRHLQKGDAVPTHLALKNKLNSVSGYACRLCMLVISLLPREKYFILPLKALFLPLRDLFFPEDFILPGSNPWLWAPGVPLTPGL